MTELTETFVASFVEEMMQDISFVHNKEFQCTKHVFFIKKKMFRLNFRTTFLFSSKAY